MRSAEAPGINASAAGTLLAGSVVTVEPGVYLPDRGGVRIEDTLAVAEEASGRAGIAHPVPQGTGGSGLVGVKCCDGQKLSSCRYETEILSHLLRQP
jgi:Xaa-Pro aminopeptidase